MKPFSAGLLVVFVVSTIQVSGLPTWSTPGSFITGSSTSGSSTPDSSSGSGSRPPSRSTSVSGGEHADNVRNADTFAPGSLLDPSYVHPSQARSTVERVYHANLMPPPSYPPRSHFVPQTETSYELRWPPYFSELPQRLAPIHQGQSLMAGPSSASLPYRAHSSSVSPSLSQQPQVEQGESSRAPLVDRPNPAQHEADRLALLAQLHASQDDLALTLAERMALKHAYQLAIRQDLFNARGQLGTTTTHAPPQPAQREGPEPVPKSAAEAQALSSQDHHEEIQPAYYPDSDLHRKYLEERGIVMADETWKAPLPDAWTPLQKEISKFRLPSRTNLLHPRALGVGKFYGAITKSMSELRLATLPDLADAMSLARLSGQRLLANKDVWKRMGLRAIFAQTPTKAYAIADAQMLKGFFPTMPPEDHAKLVDGSVAMVQIERLLGPHFEFSLFSVFDRNNLQLLKG